MPLYEYQCQKCDKIFEMLVRNSNDTKNLTCPHCLGKKLSKLFSTFGTNSDQRTSAGPASASSHSGCSSCASGSCSTCK